MKYVRKHSVDAVPFLAADIYEKVSEELEKDGHLDCECIGGGRIKHDPAAKKIHVYGYSMVRDSCNYVDNNSTYSKCAMKPKLQAKRG